jgi:hypothetical protein
VYINGAGTAVDASLRRADVGAAYPSMGANHGFDATIALAAGTYSVCVYGYNIGAGQSTTMWCGSLTMRDNPVGSLDVAQVEPSGVHLAGWVLDPNTAASTQVHVYADGVGRAFTASRSRPDVAAAYAGYGAAHGFDFFVPVPAGGLCAFAFNLLQGTESPLLGCPALSSNPFGSFDALYLANGVRRAAGWAVDPNTGQPIEVHLYVGPVGTRAVASRSRPDVAAIYPQFGSAHGFDAAVPFGDQVCAYAINVGPGGNVLLGCRSG